MTVNEAAIVQYTEFCQYQKNLDNNTLKAYRIDLTQYSRYIRENKGVTEQEMLSMYLQHLHGLCQPRTIKRKIASLRAFYNYCLDFEYIDHNPFSQLHVRYNTPKTLPRTIPREDVWKLLQTAHDEMLKEHKTIFEKKTVLRDVSVLELLFATGIRVSELCNIDIADMRVNEQLLKIMGKGAKERIVQVTHPVVLTVLRNYIAICVFEDPVHSPLFYTRNGSRISEGAVRRIINKYAELAGLFTHLTPHMFRHTFATLLLEEGVDIRYIQTMLGHSSISTTQIYTHVAVAKQRDILANYHPRNKMAI